MNNDLFQFYKSIDDPRAFLDDFSDPREWRLHLREKIFKDRKGLSDLSKRKLVHSFDLHESLFSRRWTGKQSWQWILFAGPNVAVLDMSEHIPNPPSRTVCFWISVAHYGIDSVEKWIESLPFKSAPDKPWRGSRGIDIISQIPEKRKIGNEWYIWFDKVKNRLDCIA